MQTRDDAMEMAERTEKEPPETDGIQARFGGEDALPSDVDCGDLSPLYPIGDLSPKTSATGRRGGMPWGEIDGSRRQASGAKAVTNHRSPSPGGITERLLASEHKAEADIY